MTLTLPDFALEVYLGRHEFSAKHYLCGSDAQTLTVRELLNLANDDEREGLRPAAAVVHTPLGRTTSARRHRGDIRRGRQ